MANLCDKDKWYAIFVVTGEEDNVKERLKFRFPNDEIRPMVPRKKVRERKGGEWHEKVRILFPGYVLVYGDIGIDEYYKLKNIPGLIRLLKTGDTPVKIDIEEMQVLANIIGYHEVVGYSDVILENGKIIVTDGPLVNMEGYIVSLDRRKGRAKVRISLLGEERVIELGVNIIKSL